MGAVLPEDSTLVHPQLPCLPPQGCFSHASQTRDILEGASHVSIINNGLDSESEHINLFSRSSNQWQLQLRDSVKAFSPQQTVELGLELGSEDPTATPEPRHSSHT